MNDKLEQIEELVDLFKRKFWIFIVITVITTGLAILKSINLSSTYVATADIFISKGHIINQDYTAEDLAIYTKIMNGFNEISKVDGFFDDSLQRNGIDKTSTEVAEAITITPIEHKPEYTISYTSSEEKDVTKILEVVCVELITRMKKGMVGIEATIVSEPRVTTVYNNRIILPIIAFVIGSVISIGIILLLNYVNRNINGKKQLEKLLPIRVIGQIPLEQCTFKDSKK